MVGFPTPILLMSRFVTLMCRTLQPRTSKLVRFRLIPVRSPLLGEWFLFLVVLRCFSSHGSLQRTYFIQCVMLVVRTSWFPNSDIPGYIACSQLPEAYRSVPRPSSAFDAKAFTVSS